MNDTILKVENLHKHFPIKAGVFLREVNSVKAVNDVSFEVYKGETFGIVGESGCGKSTLALSILGLEKPTKGNVYFQNQQINTNKISKELRSEIQVIFQDPYESLNPRMTVGEIISEGLRIKNKLSKTEMENKVFDLLEDVGLEKDSYYRYAHEFSGGQRQRIGIARALIMNPKLIVCDEPVSALDVSVQSQIINLLVELQKKYNITYIFIAHGLNVVKYISDRIAVMYLGKIVELGDSQSVFTNPLHPYTKALLNAVPDIEGSQKIYTSQLKGDVPSTINLPEGCTFHPRCEKCMPICKTQLPESKIIDGTMVACHLY